MQLQLLYLALWSVSSQAVYISRMATVQRTRGPNPSPSIFRPGPSMARWNPNTIHRFAQAPSNRAPYILYRNPSNRFMKPYNQGITTRSIYNMMNSNPWKTTRIPVTSNSDLDFVKAASQLRLQTNGGRGGIHTVPAPNLSLSEKPIVVMESPDSITVPNLIQSTTESIKHVNEVTEKFFDPVPYHLGAKIVEKSPIGFTKPSFSGIHRNVGHHLSAHDLSAILRNNAAIQLASDYGIQAIGMPSGPIMQQQQQPIHIQGFHAMSNPHEFVQPALESFVIPQSALYQPDPSFLQKIQNQLLQRFPGVEFIPYNIPNKQQGQISQLSTPQIFVTTTDSNKASSQHNLAVLPLNVENHKNVVRETQESTVTLLPQTFSSNSSEEIEVVAVTEPQNITVELVEVDSEPSTSTIKYVLDSSTQETATPIYYAQIGQTVSKGEANGFYSAINDVRAASINDVRSEAVTEQSEETTPTRNETEIITTTTFNPDLKQYFIERIAMDEHNQTIKDVKPLLGVPFGKTGSEIVEVTEPSPVYVPKPTEASKNEEKQPSTEKVERQVTRQAPLRLVTNVERRTTTSTHAPAKLTVVKAKIPPRSKLTFDEKTGEPILRIYASYVDSPLQKDLIASKLANIKHVKEIVTRKQDANQNWKRESLRNLDKESATNANQVGQFGLKLKSRMDDIIPIFDDYEE